MAGRLAVRPAHEDPITTSLTTAGPPLQHLPDQMDAICLAGLQQQHSSKLVGWLGQPHPVSFFCIHISAFSPPHPTLPYPTLAHPSTPSFSCKHTGAHTNRWIQPDMQMSRGKCCKMATSILLGMRCKRWSMVVYTLDGGREIDRPNFFSLQNHGCPLQLAARFQQSHTFTENTNLIVPALIFSHKAYAQVLFLAYDKGLERLPSHYLMVLKCFTPLSKLNLQFMQYWCISFSGTDLYPSHVQHEIPTLKLHNPLMLMKTNMRLFYCCCPMCKKPITGALAESVEIRTPSSSNSPQDKMVCSQEPIRPYEGLVFTFQYDQNY